MRRVIFLAALLLFIPSVLLAEARSYVTDSIKIIDIEDVHRESQAWGICAAAYDLLAEIIQESMPARARQLADLANGAELAVTMSMVVDGFDSDITPERFSRLWSFSKLSGAEIPKAMMNTLLADLEEDSSEGNEEFLSDLGKTVEVCILNTEGQQTYIDIYRDFAKSGLLAAPDQ